jgi:uncharacterized protein YndB with AHSA1/START domain
MATVIGVLSVRRSIFIRASLERVWEEFTSFERMKAWFGNEHMLRDGRRGHRLTRYEPGPGGYFETDAGQHKDGERLVFGGRIVVWDPPRELTFENDWYGHGWAAPPLFTIRLTPALEGTVVEIFSHGFERVGPTGADDQLGFENGWTTRQLEALREIVTG